MGKISSWTQIPAFSSSAEEHEYWSKHQLDPVLLNASCIKNTGNESTTITLRIDPRMLARLKRLAGQRYLNYQSMLKQWVAERLEKELDGKNQS
jgi:predicted DNA binding CopG/RHH family protein